MVLNRCGLLCTVFYICKLCLKTDSKSQVLKHSGDSDNAEPSLQSSVDLSRLGFISTMSTLTSRNKKKVSTLLISVVMILGSLKITFGYIDKELYITFKKIFYDFG